VDRDGTTTGSYSLNRLIPIGSPCAEAAAALEATALLAAEAKRNQKLGGRPTSNGLSKMTNHSVSKPIDTRKEVASRFDVSRFGRAASRVCRWGTETPPAWGKHAKGWLGTLPSLARTHRGAGRDRRDRTGVPGVRSCPALRRGRDGTGNRLEGNPPGLGVIGALAR